jgi:hypothetical protein
MEKKASNRVINDCNPKVPLVRLVLFLVHIVIKDKIQSLIFVEKAVVLF